MNAIEPIYLPVKVRTPEMQSSCIYDTILKSRELQALTDAAEVWSMGDVMSQLLQEAGEFSEQVMIKAGKIPYKEGELDGDFLEAADIINCVVDALSKLNPSMSPAELQIRLAWAIDKKNESWADATMKRLDNASESGIME